MSMEIIFRSLEKLVELHQSLYQYSLQKTIALKEGSIDELQQILIKERKITQAVELAEQTRHKEVRKWLDENDSAGDGTVTEMLKVIGNESDREILAHLSTKLTEEITKLKHNAQLNHALLEQSLQFVQLSLDVMNPTLKNKNYGKQSATYSNNRSVFDSKA